MCPYCEYLKNSTKEPHYHAYIILKEEFDADERYSIPETHVRIEMRRESDSDMNIKNYIETIFSSDNGAFHCTKVNINYCPFCGEKL